MKVLKKVACIIIALTICMPVCILSEEEYTGVDSFGTYLWGAKPENHAEFEKWIGRPQQYVLDFIGKETWNSISEPSWLTDVWKNTKYKDKLILSVPMIPDQPADATLANGAAGD